MLVTYTSGNFVDLEPNKIHSGSLSHTSYLQVKDYTSLYVCYDPWVPAELAHQI